MPEAGNAASKSLVDKIKIQVGLYCVYILQKKVTMETLTETKSNVQLIQQACEDFLKGNIPAVIETCSDDVEWGSYENPDVPFSATYHGKKGVAEFFTTLSESVHYSRFDPQQFVSQGDDVLVLGHQTGTVKATGKSFDHNWCFSFKVQNGKLKRFFAYVDSRDQSKAFK